ncbi:hypothetical protein Slin15195_G118620 [Septoria linicola]|uniref:DNA/RNA-binding protein Alba-like domain-containing protein n=1 Tax=Septoria linicola TaxID=215465 RepID=A0A9Q9B6W5_9PEZI|nr:hypothetical protein Slin14017_G095610 [Septoria linicola]USW58543.1 hypothetical protein Slin15195_G118620 [Septoria linicola]
MAFEDSSLSGRYVLVNLGVAQGTQISSRTSAVVGKLTASSDGGTKSTVVALTAASKAAGKLISIVEIAKRELATKGVKAFQYNALSSRMTDVPRRRPGLENGDAESGAEDNDSDDAFEVMGQAQESDMKKRNVPLMTIYLSTASVKELKLAFGEQKT